ncbi:hypothetical protein B0T26DRAFT_407329 [Lasiosphaeria miniovina]|uniref:Uncharacterized protein n=1 Tax=Lasiosphaeria miniovina TaxID=1954250 RepID=A0AA40DRN1_9PEZI|nr:uncharacterized protein B0T26DRAFT_407329 [Lasiosphaeria miniovina]KAK0709473.1 hypothetical protein B0T26DRAFT_407329 [Lasiosphaeria miniovina]
MNHRQDPHPAGREHQSYLTVESPLSQRQPGLGQNYLPLTPARAAHSSQWQPTFSDPMPHLPQNTTPQNTTSHPTRPASHITPERPPGDQGPSYTQGSSFHSTPESQLSSPYPVHNIIVPPRPGFNAHNSPPSHPLPWVILNPHDQWIDSAAFNPARPLHVSAVRPLSPTAPNDLQSRPGPINTLHELLSVTVNRMNGTALLDIGYDYALINESIARRLRLDLQPIPQARKLGILTPVGYREPTHWATITCDIPALSLTNYTLHVQAVDWQFPTAYVLILGRKVWEKATQAPSQTTSGPAPPPLIPNLEMMNRTQPEHMMVFQHTLPVGSRNLEPRGSPIYRSATQQAPQRSQHFLSAPSQRPVHDPFLGTQSNQSGSTDWTSVSAPNYTLSMNLTALSSQTSDHVGGTVDDSWPDDMCVTESRTQSLVLDYPSMSDALNTSDDLSLSLLRE